MSRCKCSKTDIQVPEPGSRYFEDITTKMEERRCDLIGRQKYLRDKITTMERSIPALIAYNMWMAKDMCDDAPYCKVRNIMKRFSTHPDPTEKLLGNLKKTVKELHGETTELHEKIIQADVKLEETDMELESLELANKEMNDTLNNLEKEVGSYTSPSLHSIHSEDLICLSKIRQLAKEELCLKNCIRELELKETLFKEHMDRLLTSREYQNVCDRRKVIGCLQDMDCSGKNICCIPKKCLRHKPTGHRSKKKLGKEEIDVVSESERTQTQSDAIVSTSEHDIKDKQNHVVKQKEPKEKIEKKSSWMPNWWSGNQKAEEVTSLKDEETITLPTPENSELAKSAQLHSSEGELKNVKEINDKPSKSNKTGYTIPSCKPCGHSVCPPPSSMKSGDHRKIKTKTKLCAGKFVLPCDIPCNKLYKGCSQSTVPSTKPLCELIRCLAADHGIRKSCKPFIPPCNLGNLCEICPSMSCKDYPRIGNCRCNCKGKCALGLSDAECNCSDALLDPSDEYQPTASKLHMDPHAQDSNSDDEFCECCSCGCEDSNPSFACQCN
ncbi:uncharacterized protein LOC122405255 isoform X1 [Colletes gigas]|uniref:uncharacterized protein LOC122405255 isoform X1 n=1 Tax=Colletes gigas TaxID=935657 RepID=UPI001C9AD380|nr:uncharacterized protein LOC122405255 isoform X1 [Colletes gigas]